MTTTVSPSLRALPSGTPAAASLVMRLLAQIGDGELKLRTPDGQLHRFGPGGDIGNAGSAQLSIDDWSICREVLTGGDVAFAEAYLHGRCHTTNLTELLHFMACNRKALDRALYGQGWRQWILRLRHLLRANTKTQARRNICAHYDLGNEFYRLWLDPTMTYSAAIFSGEPNEPLAVAQISKYERILQQLNPNPGDHLLELGCGWGGFAEYAARTRKVYVTGVSLSPAQTAYARERISRAGLSDRVKLEIRDYRDIKEIYDGVVSVEMFEAVGERWWPNFFKTVHDALRPGGRAVIQTITISDQRFEGYLASSDFIQQYIFPGGMLCSPTRFMHGVQAAALKLENAFTFGKDYAETLRRWALAFESQLPAITALGFDAKFIRLWRYYFSYCIAGFTSETTDVSHYTLSRAL